MRYCTYSGGTHHSKEETEGDGSKVREPNINERPEASKSKDPLAKGWQRASNSEKAVKLLTAMAKMIQVQPVLLHIERPAA